MSTFPAAGYITNNARTEGEVKTALDDWLASTKQLPGGTAESTLTIASGSVTPTGPSHKIDTEGAAASDDLTNIAQTNLPDGSVLIIRCANASRTVVVKHAAGGTGQISLRDGVDMDLAETGDFLWLRRDGALWQEVVRHRQSDLAGVRRGYRWGLIISNSAGGDAINDLDFATGEAASDDAAVSDRVLLTLDSALTKQIDATWAAGSAAGMRDSADNLTGVKTFHIFLFKRSGGARDIFASTSLTPTLPDSGTKKRRIASLKWNGSAWVLFKQRPGGRFVLKTPVKVVDATAPGTSAVTRTLDDVGGNGIITGVEVEAMVTGTVSDSAAATAVAGLFTALDQADTAPALGLAQVDKAAGDQRADSSFEVRTDTSGQIRTRLSASNGNIALRIMLFGWTDDLGVNG